MTLLAYTDPSAQSARAFRIALNALAHPGRLYEFEPLEAPKPMSAAMAHLALVLLDPTTAVALEGQYACKAVQDWITFHTNAPLVSAPEADFVLCDMDTFTCVDHLKHGDPQYPDRSATVIGDISNTPLTPVQLRGPGIKDETAATLPHVSMVMANAQRFPMGVDFFFTQGAQVIGLPRSTKVSLSCM